MQPRIRVAIVEDDPGVRSLLSRFVAEQPDMVLAFAAGSVEACFAALEERPGKPDVLLQDIGLPGESGLAAVRRIKAALPETEILMFTVADEGEKVFQAFCAGASGYLLKNTRLPDLRRAIVDVHAGMAAMSPSIAKKVVSHFRPTEPAAALSPTELHVVELLTEGMSYKMIAARMQVSINTVRTHIRHIYRKRHVNSKSEVVSKRLKGEI